MQKKNLFVGALLVCLLTMFTGCKEIMGSLDNPVSSYLKMNKESVTIYRGKTLQIDKTIYTTISDAKPQFTSSNPEVAAVDAATGLITAVSVGECEITISLPATDCYLAASAKLKVTVDGLIKLSPVSKEIALGDTYNIGATTTSDGTLTYESSNTKVATVDATGKVTTLACGDAVITVSVPATASFIAETAIFTAKVRITDADNFKTAFDAGVTYFYFADNAKITLGTTHFKDNKYIITGNPDAPVQITQKGSFYFNNSFSFSNAVIDASSLTNPIFKMEDSSAEKNSKNFWVLDYLSVDNVKFNGVKSYVYDDNKKAFIFNTFAFNNCVFNLNQSSDQDTPFRFQAGGPVYFSLKNSTMYQNSTKNYKYLVKISSGNFPDKAFDSFTGPYTWEIENNTFYKVFSKGELLNGGRVGNNYTKTSISLQNNIFSECYVSGNKFLRILFGSKSGNDLKSFVSITTNNNTYTTNGTAVSGMDTYDTGTILTTDPAFKDAANGDFTPTGADQVANKTGDPRWIK